MCYSGVYNDIMKWLDKRLARVPATFTLEQFLQGAVVFVCVDVCSCHSTRTANLTTRPTHFPALFFFSFLASFMLFFFFQSSKGCHVDARTTTSAPALSTTAPCQSVSDWVKARRPVVPSTVLSHCSPSQTASITASLTAHVSVCLCLCV